jgi:hypothetical protein
MLFSTPDSRNPGKQRRAVRNTYRRKVRKKPTTVTLREQMRNRNGNLLVRIALPPKAAFQTHTAKQK